MVLEVFPTQTILGFDDSVTFPITSCVPPMLFLPLSTTNATLHARALLSSLIPVLNEEILTYSPQLSSILYFSHLLF